MPCSNYERTEAHTAGEAHLSRGHGVKVCQQLRRLLQVWQKLGQRCKCCCEGSSGVPAGQAASQGSQISCKPPELLCVRNSCMHTKYTINQGTTRHAKIRSGA